MKTLSTRVLPPHEWPRLVGTEAEAAWPHFNPDTTRVLVVEDDGVIVATWTFLRVVHAECVWIAPSHRSRLGIVKRLLQGMRAIAAEWGGTQVVTGSVSPTVTDLIMRLGGVPMPCDSFLLPVTPPVSRLAARRPSEEMSCR